MTASEPLTMEEEYQMQQSWRDDENSKVIRLFPTFPGNREGTGPSSLLGGMIGDVNLYFNDHDDPHNGEIEVMIAESEARKKGYALEALQLFTPKISLSNDASRRLFTEKLRYSEVSVSEIFQEVTLQRRYEPTSRDWVETVQGVNWTLSSYD
ncbi:N-acetyltransferase 9 [Blyttiomyces sp. JEL0837]|nr:N-acetyltransferase 9 [Blyttiomyces sp. JEL0837]